MPKVCVVPGCKTRSNEKVRGVKYSLFSIPKDEEIKSQWIKAIPGIKSLTPTQVICEKHFPEQCIIKEFIQKDVDGNILYKSVYQRRHLHKSAVPTIFKDSDMPPLFLELKTEEEMKTEDSSDIKSLCKSREDFVSNLQPSATRTVDVNHNGVNNRILQMAKTENAKNIGNNSKRNIDNMNNISEGSPKLKIIQNAGFDKRNHKIVGVLKKVPKATMLKIMARRRSLKIYNIGNNTCKQPNIKVNPVTNPVNGRNNKETSFITTKDDDDTSKLYESLPETYAVEHNYALHDLPRPIFCTNAVNIDPKSLELPKTWGATEKTIQNKKYLLLTKVITRMIDQRQTEVLQKYMLLDCIGKNASYFVYGHEVKDIITLPEVIHSTDILLRSLNIFEAMNVCEGLGPIDPSLIKNSEVLRDSANCIRHANCPWLLTRMKTCTSCKKLKRIISIRSNKVARNGIITKEMFNNLRRQLAREKRRRKNAVEEKRMLLKEVSERSNELQSAVNYKMLFKNIFLEHNVHNNYRLTLKEILETSRAKPRGRRYSKEWLMFCASVVIRSSSMYEFLRKTNIIPLPSLHTIRSYFYGKTPRHNFDETFIDLVKNYQAKNAQQDPETLIYQNTIGSVFQLDER
ncbi:uncharacterized protein LOC108736054 isoform X2 [Agrilus planipennis]|uniref:Uncharacterized protein LOC108736054 isoform X2 n=1 Tax=Agrilus planipennis TaxID=224129 RepID=A0A7F5RKG2_AGRPL|nr:uncharacterized protein LOC108736054 isoform X2 [Agrilus planipennis]